MKVLTRRSEVMINGKKLKVSELILNLKNLPSHEVRDFFTKQKTRVPRKVRISVLRTILDPQLKDKKIKDSFSDELRYRLNWYPQFSEYQLEALVNSLNNEELFNLYREDFWIGIMSFMDDLKIDDISLFTLSNKGISYGIDAESVETFVEFNRAIDSIFFDEPGELDGLPLNVFRDALNQSSTLVELRELGSKYGIDVPRRIKKNELMDIIFDELKASSSLTTEIEEKVKKMSVMGLQRFAKDNKIKASIELKKEDIIEYIISHLELPTQEEPAADVLAGLDDELADLSIPVPSGEIAPDSDEAMDIENMDIADIFGESVAERSYKEEIVVPESKVETDGIGSIDPFASMSEPSSDLPTPGDDMAAGGVEGMDDMADDIDIFATPEPQNEETILAFEDTVYEEPTIPQAPGGTYYDEAMMSDFPTDASGMMGDERVNAHVVNTATPGGAASAGEMAGFKSELTEFNKKLESLIEIQYRMMTGKMKVKEEEPEDTITPGKDIFDAVLEETRTEEELKKKAADEKATYKETIVTVGGPAVQQYANNQTPLGLQQNYQQPLKQSSLVELLQGTPEEGSKEEIEARRKAKAKKKDSKAPIVVEKGKAAKKVTMSPEEIRLAKEEARRIREEEKALREAEMDDTGMSLAAKLFITFAIIVVVVAFALFGFYLLYRNGILSGEPWKGIYDFFVDLAKKIGLK